MLLRHTLLLLLLLLLLHLLPCTTSIKIPIPPTPQSPSLQPSPLPIPPSPSPPSAANHNTDNNSQDPIPFANDSSPEPSVEESIDPARLRDTRSTNTVWAWVAPLLAVLAMVALVAGVYAVQCAHGSIEGDPSTYPFADEEHAQQPQQLQQPQPHTPQHEHVQPTSPSHG